MQLTRWWWWGSPRQAVVPSRAGSRGCREASGAAVIARWTHCAVGVLPVVEPGEGHKSRLSVGKCASSAGRPLMTTPLAKWKQPWSFFDQCEDGSNEPYWAAVCCLKEKPKRKIKINTGRTKKLTCLSKCPQGIAVGYLCQQGRSVRVGTGHQCSCLWLHSGLGHLTLHWEDRPKVSWMIWVAINRQVCPPCLKKHFHSWRKRIADCYSWQ